jgi:aryl-alcohol dehydrogenase-like predicted oxidoreductase
MRIALGCMRLSTEPGRDDARALLTMRAAKDGGIVTFDTAHAYGLDQADAGHNERLIATVRPPRVVTKCGMRRDGGAWVPDGRARRIEEDVEASVVALGDVPIHTLLLHAPDPRTSLATTGRALARALERGQATCAGASNVSRKQLEELLEHVPLASVEVALGAYDDLAIRSGVVSLCLERGIEVLAHAPLGGPARVQRLARDRVLAQVAARVSSRQPEVTSIEVFLAYLLAVNDRLVPVVGARRPETIRSLLAAARLTLEEDDLVTIDGRFPVLGALRRPARATSTSGRPRDVVLMMGLPGAGKSRAAESLVARGYERLNRDTLGGTLRGIVRRLDDLLRAGAGRVVLDNTYVTRATRSDVLRVAQAHGASVRCVFFDTPPHEARINVVLRMMQRFGSVLEPAELAARSREDAAALPPSAVYRMTRDLEPPAPDEGFASIETVPFVREHPSARGRPGIAVSLDAGVSLQSDASRGAAREAIARALAGSPDGAPCLVFGWRPGLDDDSRARVEAMAKELAGSASRIVDVAFCTHAAGPPVCWCRPPLPGLWLDFARRHGVDARESTLVGRTPADRAVAIALGLRLVGGGGGGGGKM